jgi:hypothetical protein
MLTSRSSNGEGSILTKCLRERIHIGKHLLINTLRKREREGGGYKLNTRNRRRLKNCADKNV